MGPKRTTYPADEPVRVAVCVITHQRPEGLTRLIRALDALSFQKEPPNLQIIVVDNDSTGSALGVCERLRDDVQWPVEYTREPRRGIPQARNKAVQCAVNQAEFLAFIDDDEVPDMSWLDELLRVQRTHDADVVAGPVVPHFMELPQDWIVKGGFFEHPRYATGHPIKQAGTGNVLLRSKVFTAMERPFDERFALTGGEDIHFFLRLHRAGYKMVWADGAVAHEWIPASRANLRWIIRRFYRIGATRSFRDLDLAPWPGRYVTLFAKALGYIGAGILLIPFGCVVGRHKLFRYFRYIGYGAGMVVGLAGTPYEQYDTTDGA